MNLRPSLKLLALPRIGWRTLLLCLFVVACGGGVESGGTGGNASASYVSGPITGFGSVIVNDVRFDDSTASVSDAEGATRSRDDLKLGMTINLRGSPIATDNTGSQNGSATSIVYGSAIVGPVTAIDSANAGLTVLGQAVDVVATTVFDDSLSGGISALSVGDVIEVYALFDASAQRYRATRIELKSGITVFQLRGVVAGLNTTTRTFTIGGETVSYLALPGSDVPAGLANGSIVRVDLQATPAGGLRTALRIRNAVVLPENRDEVRIDGLITTFRSATDFSVDGVGVDASRASFPDGTAGLGVGTRVALRGTVDSGVLAASLVRIKSQDQVNSDGFDLRGLISSIDRTAMRFVLRGVNVDYSGTAIEYKDGTAADLGVLVSVEVRGRLAGNGNGLIATRITFKR